jgi:hypothetical protein
MAATPRVSRIPSETRLQPTTKARACFTEICPEATGRAAVRATCRSTLRSTTSLKAQPAARIRQAPIRKPRYSQASYRSGVLRHAASARVIPCQPGSSSSQMPIGRSNRPSFSQGFHLSGAWRSTQLVGAASGRGAVMTRL